MEGVSCLEVLHCTSQALGPNLTSETNWHTISNGKDLVEFNLNRSAEDISAGRTTAIVGHFHQLLLSQVRPESKTTYTSQYFNPRLDSRTI